MPHQVLFVQGGGEDAHDKWDNKLVEDLVGATILIQALAEEPTLMSAGLFLIAAPFVGDGGWHSEDIKPLPDLCARLSRQTPIYLYHGSKDDTAPLGHADLYAQAVPQAVVRRLSGRDHQLNNDMSEVAADIRRHYSV